MTAWSYNPKTRIAGEVLRRPITRERLEDAAVLLLAVRPALSHWIIVDTLRSLSGLSRGEVLFNLNLVLGETDVRSI